MFSELRFVSRALLKSRGFALTVVLTLSLGIGATTAIFGVVHAVLLRPLPYSQPEQLVRIYSELPDYPRGGIRRFVLSKPEYLEVKRESTLWRSIEAWVETPANVSATGQPVVVPASLVTGGMLRMLGVAPLLGRAITPQDDLPGAPPVAVISYGLWQRAFAADRAVQGRGIMVNGVKCTVIGVMPSGFGFPLSTAYPPEIWLPLQIDPANPGDATSHILSVLGRLKSGVTLQQARGEISALVAREQGKSGHHLDSKSHPLVLYGWHQEVVRDVQPVLETLFGAVCFLLLIACMNVANLMLARAEARRGEIAIRGALGAGIWRLVRQFATESLLLSGFGAAVGVALAFGALQWTLSGSDLSLPRATEIRIDAPVILFAVVTSVLTGLVFGLVPLAQLRGNLQPALKSGSAAGDPRAQRFRHGLVIGQLALALVLLTGTGLMLRAFWKLQALNPGFDPKAVITTIVRLPSSYSDVATRGFWGRAADRLNALPGVVSAALATDLPGAARPVYDDIQIEGAGPSDPLRFRSVDFCKVVTGRYFDTLRIHIVEGRAFDERDGTGAPPTAIINQTMARTFWGDRNPLGQRVRLDFSAQWFTVIGVSADAKNAGLDRPTETELYLPYAQVAPDIAAQFLSAAYVVVRPQGTPTLLAGVIRQELSAIDPMLAPTKLRSLDDVIASTQSKPRLLTVLLGAFAGVALILAAVGVYGVIAYSVAQRTREFGIRMALGAQTQSVLALVLRGGLTLTAFGIVIGVAGAAATTRFLSGYLFEVTPTDPATFTVVVLLLAGVALIACYLPARRATRVDPLVALRTE